MNVNAVASRMQATPAAQLKPPTRNDNDSDDRSSVTPKVTPKVATPAPSAAKGLDTYA